LAVQLPFATPRPRKSRLELSPLLNLLLVLLVVVALGYVLRLSTRSVPLNLPLCGFWDASSSNQDAPLTVILAPNHMIYLGDTGPFQLGEFRGRLKQWMADSPNPKVIVAGTDNVAFGDSVHVMDEVRRAGISRVSVDTALRPQPRY
jgi:biopolymer transport protein ExbD